jgi:hypothetical protein
MVADLPTSLRERHNPLKMPTMCGSAQCNPQACGKMSKMPWSKGINLMHVTMMKPLGIRQVLSSTF